MARGAGKTIKMIEWLRGDNRRVLITFSEKEKARLQEFYKDVEHRIVTWQEYCDRRGIVWRKEIKEVGIDNADIILQAQIRDELAIISISEDEL